MSYKELKDYINRTLGSSLKCLLSSYWWKKIFGYIVGTMEESEASLREPLNSVKNAYKDRCFYIAEYRADDYKAHNAELFVRILTGNFGYAPREPIYFLTGSDLDNDIYACCPNYAVESRVNFNDDGGYDLEHYIRALDIPIERWGVAEVEIYQDGSYVVNPNFRLYYRSDGGKLTEEEKEFNIKLIRPFRGWGGDASLLSRIHCYDAGKLTNSVVIGQIHRTSFIVTKGASLLVIEVDNSTGGAGCRTLTELSPVYYLPAAVADLTPENNEYTFTESESLKWLLLYRQNGFLSKGCIMIPYKVGSAVYYKRADMTQPVGDYPTYAADFISINSATGKATDKRVRYDINGTGVTVHFDEDTFDCTSTIPSEFSEEFNNDFTI